MTSEEPQRDQTQPDPMVEFEYSQRQALRARLALNILVVLSATASALFLVYVLARVIPRGGAQPPVNVPTSEVAKRVGLLRGSHIGLNLDFTVELRDVDEAAGYRDQLSEQMRNAMGVAAPGRVYRLEIRNGAKSAELRVRGGSLRVKARGGASHEAGWLAAVADPEKADPTGRMLLAQSRENFTLAPGEARAIYVFVAAANGAPPPSAEEMSGGELNLEGVAAVLLSHTEVNSGQ